MQEKNVECPQLEGAFEEFAELVEDYFNPRYIPATKA